MKFEGRINGIPISILLDSGTTHNFVSKKLVNSLGIKSLTGSEMVIRLGDGYRVKFAEQCPEIKVEMGEFECQIRALVFDIGKLDLILGMDWLRTLGEVWYDWESRRMRFWHHGKRIELVGSNMKMRSCSSLQSIWRQEGGVELVVEKYKQRIGEGLDTQQQQELDTSLSGFALVFAEPKGLPPQRQISHSINLAPGSSPVCVRPYLYSHYHKDDIQRQVQEMKEQGIVRDSSSAYSSPVFLVKKKDATWRLCVDYRALNKLTIPDKYPIPVVDGVLEESYDATYFSKIDLKAGYHQILMRKEDIENTAFRTHNGHYEFLVTPFGLTNDPATFQTAMNAIFRFQLRKWC